MAFDEAADRELESILSSIGTIEFEDEARNRLRVLVDQYEEARRIYLQHCQMHAMLRESTLLATFQAEKEEQAGSSVSRQKRISWVLLAGISVAACFLIVFGTFVSHFSGDTSSDDESLSPGAVVEESDGRGFTNQLEPDHNAVSDHTRVSDSTDNPTDDGVAVLTHAVDVEWGDQSGREPNEILSPGELRLNTGVIQIELYNGVRLILEGPAELEIVSVASVICREGKLRVIVPPNAIGFGVLTPDFRLVDRGTEFAVDVQKKHRSHVHVFDGEVELFLPDNKQKKETKHVLSGGEAMACTASGISSPITAKPDAFISFEALRVRDHSAAQKRFTRWKQWNESLRDDPRIVARYDFESSSSKLTDGSLTESHGTIVGCEWVTGRWPTKRALAFTRPGDRVRLDIPGEFDAITVAAWVRVDALPARRQSLVLTDGYELGCLHWQIGPEGELRFGTRISPRRRQFSSGYASPTVFSVRQLGVWSFICTVYDRTDGTVSHWFNGEQVFRGKIKVDQPIRIGSAEIGNWGMPLDSAGQPVRNFVGRIDELTIWNIALGEKQISEMHAESRPRSCRKNPRKN